MNEYGNIDDQKKIILFEPEAANRNFFRYHPNYSYTSLVLKHKRLLSHMIKRLLVSASNPQMAAFGVLILFALIDSKYDRCEEALVEAVEGSLSKIEEGAEIYKSIIDALSESFKGKTKKQIRFHMRWLRFLLREMKIENAFQSFEMRFEIFEINLSDPNVYFLFIRLAEAANAPIDRNRLSKIDEELCLKDTYSLISYTKYLETHEQVAKAFDLIERARADTLYDSHAIRKYYIILAINLRKQISFLELLEVLRADFFCKIVWPRALEYIYENLESLEKYYDKIENVLSEKIVVYSTSYDWTLIKRLLKIQKKKEELRLPFSALVSKDSSKIKSFTETHFSQFAFRRDFQHFVDEIKTVLKMSAYSGSFSKLLQEKLKSSILRTKASIGEKYFSPFEIVKEYRESFNKLKK